MKHCFKSITDNEKNGNKKCFGSDKVQITKNIHLYAQCTHNNVQLFPFLFKKYNALLTKLNPSDGFMIEIPQNIVKPHHILYKTYQP